MRFRLLLAVITLSLGASCAEAGLMLRDDAFSVDASAVMTELLMEHDEGEPSGYVHHSQGPSDFAATAQSPSPVNNVCGMIATDSAIAIPMAMFGSRLSLRNSVLPESPFLDGLLKPA